MKNSNIFVPAAMVLLTALAGNVQAKWWIFGSAKGDVTIRYLFLNKTSFDEADAKVTLYKEMLSQGMITVAGKADAKPNNIGNVKVSLDNKATWKDAHLSQDGAFEFNFRPEVGKTYSLFVKVTDTAGRTNDVAATHREVVLTEENIQGQAREALAKLITAYKNQDPNAFMALVSDNFAGDSVNLDRAIRNDFLAFTNIYLNFSLNNVSTDARGHVCVSLTFSRQVTSRKSGKVYADRGTTEFAFKPGDHGMSLQIMRRPLIFGLSDPEVGTGTVNTGSNEPTIVVSKDGDVSTVPPQQPPSAGESCSARSGSVTLNYTSPFNFQTFTFGTEATATENNTVNISGDLTFVCAFPNPLMIFKSGTKWLSLGTGTIDSEASVPAQSTYRSSGHTNIAFGLYALYLTSGKYALIRVNSSTFVQPGCGASTAAFDYRYQPSGTTSVCTP